MIAAVSRSFRSQGFAGIGVDGIAKAAGVTSGAFYTHFGSKDAAFHTAVEAGLDEVIDRVPQLQRMHGTDWVKAFSDYYLSRAHREDLACGCAMTALTPEVVRAGKEVRATFEAKMKIIAGLVSDGLAGRSQEDRLSRAWAMLSALIGGLTVTRAMKTIRAADAIADAVKAAAIRVAGRTRILKNSDH